MIELLVNGHSHRIRADPSTPLLYILRNDLGLVAAKFGCGRGLCGACTVLIDDQATFACLVSVESISGRSITTLEGLGSPGSPGPLQQAFEAEQAAQCGYCIAGMLMRAEALLRRNPKPTGEETRRAMNPSLCRCGSHLRILKAVRRAALKRGEDGVATTGAAQ